MKVQIVQNKAGYRIRKKYWYGWSWENNYGYGGCTFTWEGNTLEEARDRVQQIKERLEERRREKTPFVVVEEFDL